MNAAIERLGSGAPLTLRDGRSTNVWRFGAADDEPTTLLLHGWNIDGPVNFASSVEQVAETSAGYIVDLTGHGHGPRGEPFSIDRAAADVLLAANALGIEQFVPVGYSMGGAVAQRLLHAAPQRCIGVVLVATAPKFAETSIERAQFAFMQQASRPAKQLPRPAQDGILRVIASIACIRYPNWVLPHVLQADMVALLEAGGALGSFNSTESLNHWQGPSAVIVTARDRVVNPERQRRLLDLFPDAFTVELDADHDIPVRDDPRLGDALATALHHVLDSASGPTAQSHPN